MNVCRAAIAFSLVGVLAACSGISDTPARSSSPSSSVAPIPTAGATEVESSSATPSAAAEALGSPQASGALQVWQNWALATVRVNGLNVRTRPGESEPLVGDLSGQFNEYGHFVEGGVVRLNAGDHVLVLSFVEPGDGRQWVQLAAQRVGPNNPVAVGWAVAGTVDDPWVEEDNSWCPGAEPSFETLLSLTGVERMGCYASIPLTFNAHQATIQPDAGLGGVCGPVPVPWLQCEHINYNWVNRDGGYDWEFLLHFDPATGLAPTGLAEAGQSKLFTITGHFNEGAATSCAPNPPSTNEDLVAYLACSTLFVVDRIE